MRTVWTSIVLGSAAFLVGCGSEEEAEPMAAPPAGYDAPHNETTGLEEGGADAALPPESRPAEE